MSRWAAEQESGPVRTKTGDCRVLLPVKLAYTFMLATMTIPGTQSRDRPTDRKDGCLA